MDLPWWHWGPHCMGTEPVPSSLETLSLWGTASSCLHEKCCCPHSHAPVPHATVDVSPGGDSSRAHVVLLVYPLPALVCQLRLHEELPTALSTGWCLGVSPAKFKGLCGINILSHK